MKNLLLSLTLITCTSALMGSSIDIPRSKRKLDVKQIRKNHLFRLLTQALNPNNGEQDRIEARIALEELLARNPELALERDQNDRTPAELIDAAGGNAALQEIFSDAVYIALHERNRRQAHAYQLRLREKHRGFPHPL